jgi:hypothetical protein
MNTRLAVIKTMTSLMQDILPVKQNIIQSIYGGGVTILSTKNRSISEQYFKGF